MNIFKNCHTGYTFRCQTFHKVCLWGSLSIFTHRVFLAQSMVTAYSSILNSSNFVSLCFTESSNWCTPNYHKQQREHLGGFSESCEHLESYNLSHSKLSTSTISVFGYPEILQFTLAISVLVATVQMKCWEALRFLWKPPNSSGIVHKVWAIFYQRHSHISIVIPIWE